MMNFASSLKIFREGIIAALMGGFYLDFSEDAHFINVVHIYLWLFLFIMPLLIVTNYSSSTSALIISVVIVALLILIIKLITNHLHHLFDTSEAIEEVRNQSKPVKDNNELVHGDEPPKITAVDQESMFHAGSLDDIENGVVHNDKPSIIEEKAQINAILEQTNESNLQRNKSTELCILDQASRRPSTSRILPRISSARSRIIDIRKSSCPVGPNQLFIQANPCLNDKYSRLISQRNTVEYYQAELEKMKTEVNELQITVKDDFIPSIADLSMLDLNPTSRKMVTSISRSRSSSQRYCHSVHVNTASRVGSIRASKLAKGDNESSIRPLVRHRSQRRQSISSTKPRKVVPQPVARSQSLKQAGHSERDFLPCSSTSQMRRRLSANTSRYKPIGDPSHLTNRRTQSFRNDDRLMFKSSTANKFDIRPSSNIREIQSSVAECEDSIQKPIAFSNSRRQYRASSIDVTAFRRPVFTIGSDEPCPPYSTFLHRKASLDMKSRSLEVPEEDVESRVRLIKQSSFCTTETQEEVVYDKWLPAEKEIPDVIFQPTNSQLNITEFDAMLAAQLSMEDEEINALLQDKNDAKSDDLSFNQDNLSNSANNDSKKGRIIRRNAIRRHTHTDIASANGLPEGEPLRNAEGGRTTDEIESSSGVHTIPISGINPATHDDTSEGSVHLFQDESGQWMVYVFGDDSGTAMSRRHYLENILGKSPATAKDLRQQIYDKAAAEVSRATRITDSIRCDSPHPDMVDHSPLLRHNRQRYTGRITRRQNMSSTDQDLPGSSRHCSDHFATNTEVEAVVRNRRSELHGTLSNASMEQISMLDRILMNENRQISTDQFDFLHSIIGTSTNGPDRENMMLYDAIEKWFSRDKSQISTKQYYYKLALLPWTAKKFRVNFDRLQLTALFDRCTNRFEVSLCFLLAAMVTFLGFSVICRHLYHDMSLIVVCFTMASALYSLVKSVQPDTCSPQHGFNRILVFSRAAYFCLTTAPILILELLLQYKYFSSEPNFRIFGVVVTGPYVIQSTSVFLQYMLLFLPFFHTLGLLPQLNTMFMFVLEHIDIHLFGSSGSIDITSAAISVMRNLVAVAILFPLCYFGLQSHDPQNIFNSLFWGFHLTTCYFLSRLPNSIHLYKSLFKCGSKCNFQLSLKRFRGRQNFDNNQQHSFDLERNKSQVVKNQNTFLNPGVANYHELNQNNENPKKVTSMDFVDPLPEFMKEHLTARIKNDFIVCIFWGIMGFALHISTLFTHNRLQSVFRPLIIYLTVVIGFVLHYLWPQLRKPYPWLLLTQPVLKCSDVGDTTKAEGFHYWLLWLQKNLIIPVLVMNEFTASTKAVVSKFGSQLSAILIIISGMKLLKMGFSASPRLYLIILLTHLLFEYDLKYLNISESFPVNYLLISILFSKLYELWLKMNFVFIYIAPFQISWGSAFHAVAQLAFLPHSTFLVAQCVLSSILSAPLEPFLGSAIFLSSYIRPLKFWEQKYRTQRLETTNTALSSQVQGISSEQVAGNLNSIFYEHLTRSLQKSLAGDLLLGRWGGAVEHGDMFILASEDLHFVVHIIEIGNGLVTFQLRGLEFVGTYCHEQETEELRTDLVKNRGFCCCNPGRLPRCLSLNVAFRLRWVAWEFVQSPFVIEGYRVTDHSATTTMQLYELRKLIVTLYVQCIIYYTIKLPDLPTVIGKFKQSLDTFNLHDFADLDPIFNKAFDDDFDEFINGVTQTRFLSAYGEWIKFCLDRRIEQEPQKISENISVYLNPLCFGFSLLGRRSVGYISSDKTSYFQQSLTDVFLHGLHDVFKGDVRVSKDDWIFEDVTMLQKVITPAVRIALKLYQDNLANPLTALNDLYSAIIHTEKTHVICHETEPQWRFAILNDADSLFSFRRIVKPNSGDGYRIIMFTKKSLQFKVIKINRECVRGLWSSQQREQIFFRNNDLERGSIQHSRQVLRNLVNSSCDLPIGYPIYVSPLTTSLAGSHVDLRHIAGTEISLTSIFTRLKRIWNRIRYRCTESCIPAPSREHLTKSENIEMSKVIASNLNQCPGSSCYKYRQRSSSTADTISDNQQASENYKPKLTCEVSEFKSYISQADCHLRLHKITDGSQVLDRWYDKLCWPQEEWKSRLINNKTSPIPLQGLEGFIIHKWTPFNAIMSSRSFCHLNISLLSFSNTIPTVNLSDKLVLVFEKGLVDLSETNDYIAREII